MAVTAAAGPPVHAGAPHDERPIWRRPNLLRAILFFFGGAAFAYVLVGVIRTAMHESHPWHTWNAFLQVGLIAGPMFFVSRRMSGTHQLIMRSAKRVAFAPSVSWIWSDCRRRNDG